MPKKIDEQLWIRYFEYRDSCSSNEAARRAGINKTTAWRLENVPNHNSSGRKHLEAWRARNPGSITDHQRLNTQAKRALNDFAYFRLRYFGRKSTPWQAYTANLVRKAHEDAIASMEPRFLVINCPPGAGKTQLITHDIPLWLLVRDRATRILIGSATEQIAGGYTEQMLTTLERREPPPLSDVQARFGAVRAESFLTQDFGRFRPDSGRNWKAKGFRISQTGDVEATGKEMSVTAFGRDSTYLGQRVDVALWDDLVTEATMGTQEMREKTLRKWQLEAESRVEAGGVLLLIGQRLFSDDLYRYCIDLPGDGEDDEPDETSRKYQHIVFKAHYEEHCKGLHEKTDPAYDPLNPENSGCLLEPLRLGWRKLRSTMRADEQTGTSVFRVTFQQEDGDPGRALVNPLWIDGGEDPKTGTRYPGCWDEDRVAGVPDSTKLGPGLISVVSVDSSPTKYWALGWWLVDPVSKRRYLIDLHRSKMKVYDVLSYNVDSGVYTGLLERWWQASNEYGYPITRLIFEANSAEVYFLDGVEMRRWQIDRRVLVTRHKTNTNKADPNYGVQMVGPVYMHGQVRLPGDVRSGSRAKMRPLISEVTHWPDTTTTDCLMQQWFLEFNMPNIARVKTETPRAARPSWMSGIPDGRNLQLVSSR